MNYKSFINNLNQENDSLLSANTQMLADSFLSEIIAESYLELDDSTIAAIIREFHDIRVTNTIMEQYINLAIDNVFSIDPVVSKLREMNGLDTIIDGRIHYKLDDDSIVAISTETLLQLNSILENKLSAVEYMRRDSNSFLYMLEAIIGD